VVLLFTTAFTPDESIRKYTPSDGAYGFVPYLGLSLTYDHRSLDGGEATRFVKQVATEIENLELDIF
jgi:pyruvate/2-oxoglutarate dehydrogenase complex dihydrolipoamide acyltransferase (E2) component